MFTKKILPKRIYLRAMDTTWEVEFHPRKHQSLILHSPAENILLFSGHRLTYPKGVKLLKAWLHPIAKKYLLDLTAHYNARWGFKIKNIQVRNTSAQWGSCTAEKNVSLSTQLLFLPHELVRHVILHELSHTVHLNHSPKFWEVMKSHDPQYKTHRILLKKSSSFVPDWIKYRK